MKEEWKNRQDLLPREKASQRGFSALSDAELLALILRTGRKDASVLELSEEILHLRECCKGLLAIGEIARRIWNSRIRDKVQCFRSPHEVLLYFKEEMRYLDHEEVRVLYLDTKAKLIKEHFLAKGSGNSASISGRELFREALMVAANCIILVHNHPSGDPEPSKEDETFTDSVRRIGEYMGIPLVDHIIIGDNRYYSFKEQGKF